MERIGIFGGAFNPPHLGHMQAASYALAALKLNRLYLIPSNISPHKTLPDGSPTPEQRLWMTQLASAGTGAEVSDLELQRGGASYTYETVQTLSQMHPDAELYLLMGTDMFLTVHKWKNPEKFLPLVTLAVFHRGDKGEHEELLAQKQNLEAMGYRAVLFENPVLQISSTQLRRMLIFACAEPFLENSVCDYIRKNNLYGTGKSYQNLSEKELEDIVVSLLNPNRVAHVLGCRDTAVALAKRWGADETDAARAALLHDVTKALDSSLQLTLCEQYGVELEPFFLQNPKTLHALTGSLVAERIFGENMAVVRTIESHTTGKANMNTLEKIIYVADYMEPNRAFSGVEALRKLAFEDLDGAMLLGLEMTLDFLRKKGKTISPQTLEALNDLRKKP